MKKYNKVWLAALMFVMTASSCLYHPSGSSEIGSSSNRPSTSSKNESLETSDSSFSGSFSSKESSSYSSVSSDELSSENSTSIYSDTIISSSESSFDSSVSSSESSFNSSNSSSEPSSSSYNSSDEISSSNTTIESSSSTSDKELKEVYYTGFESSEGYEGGTSYNNPKFKDIGENIEWKVKMGTVSTTAAISGNMSLQMRWYSSKPTEYGCLVSNMPFEEVTKLYFVAASTADNQVKVSKSTDLQTWQNEVIYTLSDSKDVYEYAISEEGEDVYIKFDFILSDKKENTSRLYIDDISFEGYGNGIVKPSIDVGGGKINLDNIPLSSKLEYSKLSNTGADKGGISETSFFDIVDISNSYYANVSDVYVGQTLWTSLTEVTSISTSKISSYSELKTNLALTDYSSNTSNKIVDFYSGLEIDSTWNSTVWNREHLWCQSHSWFNQVSESSRNAGTDLHHLRPVISNINSSRNNSLYGIVSDKENKAKYFNFTDGIKANASNGTLYGYINGDLDPRLETSSVEGVFEPIDRVKGDVARILMYLMIRYPSYLSSFLITNIVYTTDGSVSAAYALLLKWHQQDPVSNFEFRRNHETYKIQGNRNPFIDNPTYADLIFRNLND